MSGVYVVSALNLKIQSFENYAFAGFAEASKKAIELSEMISENLDISINRTPRPEGTIDGFQWFFVDDDSAFVLVTFHNVQGSLDKDSDLKDMSLFKDLLPPINALTNKPVGLFPGMLPSKAEEVVEIMGRNIPAGFSISNKPLTNEHLLKYPYQFKSKSELTDNQKLALATARLKKASHYKVKVNGQLIESKDALSLLQSKDFSSLNIINAVLDDIELLREKRAQEMFGDDETVS